MLCNGGLEAKIVFYGKNGLDFCIIYIKIGKSWNGNLF